MVQDSIMIFLFFKPWFSSLLPLISWLGSLCNRNIGTESYVLWSVLKWQKPWGGGRGIQMFVHSFIFRFVKLFISRYLFIHLFISFIVLTYLFIHFPYQQCLNFIAVGGGGGGCCPQSSILVALHELIQFHNWRRMQTDVSFLYLWKFFSIPTRFFYMVVFYNLITM